MSWSFCSENSVPPERNQGSSPPPDNLPEKLHSVRLDPLEALRELESSGFDAVVLEFPLSGWTPEELFGRVQRLASGAAIVVRDPAMSSWDAVRLSRLGAYPAPGTAEEGAQLASMAGAASGRGTPKEEDAS